MGGDGLGDVVGRRLEPDDRAGHAAEQSDVPSFDDGQLGDEASCLGQNGVGGRPGDECADGEGDTVRGHGHTVTQGTGPVVGRGGT